MTDKTKKKAAKPGPKPGGKSAKAFILGFPREMPALDVVEKAKAAGLDISLGYVHTTRSNTRRDYKRAVKPGAKQGRPQLPKAQGFTTLGEYVLRKGTDAVRAELAAIEKRQAELTRDL